MLLIVVLWIATYLPLIAQISAVDYTDTTHVSTTDPDELLSVDELQSQNEQLQQRSRFTTGSVVMILSIGSLLIFFVYNSRWSRQMEIKNRQLQRERNIVIAQNKQLAVERDRAEAASRAKTAFLQSMTHEIRTPLNAISGFTQILSNPEIELAEEERQDYSQRIQENTYWLTIILDDLIQISDLDSDSELPASQECHPADIVKKAVDFIRPHVSPQVVLNSECDETACRTFNSHPQLIMKALEKLLSNAAKFTTSGSITLHCKCVDDTLCFSVTDTGPGITPEKKDIIFERFTKLDSFTQGTGLGLPIANMIAQRLGGQISLDTSYRGGAKFDFIIPINSDRDHEA